MTGAAEKPAAQQTSADMALGLVALEIALRETMATHGSIPSIKTGAAAMEIALKLDNAGFVIVRKPQ